MIAAGVDAYRELDREFDADERIVSDIYSAMQMVAQQQKRAKSSDQQLVEQSHWWSI
jgi:hypothetical protein